MKKIYLLFASLVVLSSTSFAESKIEGGFGVKLGDIFLPESAIGKAALTDGTPLYQYSPNKKFRSFSDYYVLTTPKTNKIYSIWARGEFENTETAKKEQALLMSLLEKKYGKGEKQGLLDSFNDLKRLDQGHRDILVRIIGFTDVVLEISYNDRPLVKLAEKERLEIEAAKVDDSGL